MENEIYMHGHRHTVFPGFVMLIPLPGVSMNQFDTCVWVMVPNVAMERQSFPLSSVPGLQFWLLNIW